MSITTRKSKIIKLGFFKRENLAWEYIEHYKKHTALPKGRVGTYYVLKRKRLKEGMKLWWAYCLHKKEALVRSNGGCSSIG